MNRIALFNTVLYALTITSAWYAFAKTKKQPVFILAVALSLPLLSSVSNVFLDLVFGIKGTLTRDNISSVHVYIAIIFSFVRQLLFIIAFYLIAKREKTQASPPKEQKTIDFISAVIVFSLFVLPALNAQEQNEKYVNEISKKITEYQVAHENNMPELLKGFYSKRIWLVQPGCVVDISGKLMQKIHEEKISQNDFTVESIREPIIQVSQDGTLACAIVNEKVTSDGIEGLKTELSASMLVFVKDNDGNWKIKYVASLLEENKQ